jgi:putative ABC transport system permease protein
MKWLDRLFRKREIETKIDSELRFHIEQKTADLVAQGVDPAEARRQAMAKLGGVEAIKQEWRESRATYFLETILQDVRYAIRTLRKSPGFTIIAVVTLVLGIGATSAIFSVANDFFLEPLPFHDPGRLVSVSEFNPSQTFTGWTDPPSFFAWKRQNHVFEGMAAWDDLESDMRFNLTGSNRPERVVGKQVSSDFFTVLGVTPVIGRPFLPPDFEPGRDRVALISYGFWQRRFGGGPGVVGKELTLDAKSYRIVGVLPKGFRFSIPAEEVWIPLPLADSGHGGRFLKVVARLKPGTRLKQANADMGAIGARLAKEWKKWNYGERVRVESLSDRYTRTFSSALAVLMAAVALVLLIACANLSALLLARGVSRRKEMAIRHALGATRVRIIRQTMTESSVLALAGGVLGLLVARVGSAGLYAALPASAMPLTVHGVDWRVVAFTLVTSLLCGIAFGTAPAWTLRQINVTGQLKDGSRLASPTPARSRLRVGLILGEIVVAEMLLTGAILLLRSFVKLSEIEPGFHPRNVLTVRLDRTDGEAGSFYGSVIDRVSKLPSVQAVGAINDLPMTDQQWTQDITVEGQPPRPSGDYIWASHRSVSGNYFQVMGIPLLEGRTFVAPDEERSVALVSKTMAKRCWPGEDPVGRQFAIGTGKERGPWVTVLGVVGDVKDKSLISGPSSVMYFPETIDDMTVVIRSRTSETTIAKAVGDVVHSVDPNQPISSILPMQEVLSESTGPARLATTLTDLFACFSLLLASLGLYGLISHSVSLRAHEIGIRIALGANKADVMRLVVSQGVKLAVIGIVIGLGAAIAAMRLIQSMLYGISSTDPLTFATVSILLFLAAFAACFVPARRAMRVDPAVALRQE